MNILEKILKNRAYLTIILAIIIFLLVWFFSIGNFFSHSNKIAQSYIANHIYSNTIWSNFDDIVIVEIDDRTTNNISRFPFDRKVYIPIIERLNQEWVALIAFDVIFADRTNSESDQALAEAITQAKNIVLWLSFSSKGYLEQPLDIFKKWAVATGFFAQHIDPITQSVFSYSPYYNDKKNKSVEEHFVVSIVKQYLWITTPSFIKDWKYYLEEDRSFAFINNKKDLLYITYSENQSYSRISLYDIYNENEFQRVKKQIDLKWKIVLIWATAKGLKDTFMTPEWMRYWVHIHAEAINNLLRWVDIKYFSKYIEWLIIMFIIIISIYFNLSRSWNILILSNIALISFFGLFFPLILLLKWAILINYFYELIFALIFSLAISNIFKYMIENKSKNKLNQALWEYVSKDIAAEILSGAGKINLDGENKKIAIFFSDIEWFTSISEKFTPEDLVSFLRIYLSEMSNIILDQRGFINKYEWDAIMALWWVFESYNESTVSEACESALQQQEKLNKLNKVWSEQWFDLIQARIWIHVWDAIIWNIWAKWRKMEFTALWDSVNLASRLEGVNKFYGTYLCVSEDVVNETKDNFSYRYLDKIRVKWKEQPVVIYELLARKWCLEQDKKEIVLEFTQWIKKYLDQNFIEAKIIFKKCYDLWDIPSKTYIERCDLYLHTSPWTNWDWVWNHDSK